MSEEPGGPADPRPNDEPYYIDTTCDACGTDLVLYDAFKGEDIDDDKVWYDEWICPSCDDGIYLDVPQDYKEALFETVTADDS